MSSIPFQIGRNKTIGVTPNGLKIGSKGKVQEPGEVLGMLPKGEARKLRKLLNAAGHTKFAAAERIAA